MEKIAFRQQILAYLVRATLQLGRSCFLTLNIKICFAPNCFLETKTVFVQTFIKISNNIKNNRLNKLCHVHNSSKKCLIYNFKNLASNIKSFLFNYFKI